MEWVGEGEEGSPVQQDPEAVTLAIEYCEAATHMTFLPSRALTSFG